VIFIRISSHTRMHVSSMAKRYEIHWHSVNKNEIVFSYKY